MWRYSEKAASASQEEASEETKPADTFSLDSQNPWLLIKPPNLWYFVMIALADKYNKLTCLFLTGSLYDYAHLISEETRELLSDFPQITQ